MGVALSGGGHRACLFGLGAGTAAELAGLGVELPSVIGDDAEIQIWEGGAIVFDQFSGPKYHVAAGAYNSLGG